MVVIFELMKKLDKIKEISRDFDVKKALLAMTSLEEDMVRMF